MSAFTDLAGDKFQKALLAISIGRRMLADCWIGWDSVVCTHICGRVASGWSDTKIRWMLPSWNMSVIVSHPEDNGVECPSG
jgi:hypothetical protein